MKKFDYKENSFSVTLDISDKEGNLLDFDNEVNEASKILKKRLIEQNLLPETGDRIELHVDSTSIFDLEFDYPIWGFSSDGKTDEICLTAKLWNG